MSPHGAGATRWTHWQSRSAARWLLAEAARTHGYTLLQVPPHAREGFFALVDVLEALPTGLPADPQAQALWQAWLTWTRRMAAYLARVAAGKEGTCPPVPPIFLEILAPEGEHDA